MDVADKTIPPGALIAIGKAPYREQSRWRARAVRSQPLSRPAGAIMAALGRPQFRQRPMPSLPRGTSCCKSFAHPPKIVAM
jgi:hypothetical protein